MKEQSLDNPPRWQIVAAKEIEQIRGDLSNMRYRLNHIGDKWTALREGMMTADGGITCVIALLYGEVRRLETAARDLDAKAGAGVSTPASHA